MSKALNQISKSPFARKIEGATLPRRFHQPMFTIYNSWTDLVEHVSNFNHRMAVHSKDEALICLVFPSSLAPVAMKWFDSLRADSIDSFKELTWAFGSHFITCTRVPRRIDSLLSLSMLEDVLGQILGNVQWDKWWLWWRGHQHFQGRPPNRAQFKEVFNWQTCHQCTPTHEPDW